MTDYKDFHYWKRRLQRSSLDLAPQDLKILINVLLQRIEGLEHEVQSIRSEGLTRSRKKLETDD